MEVIRLLQVADSESGSASACVACELAVDLGSRCDHCGAATLASGFRVTRLVAQRPHSRVYLAERDGLRIALKELSFSLVPSTTELDAFQREAQLLGTLDHPAIPRLLESFVLGSGVHTRLYLAREYVEGRSLLEKLAVHRFTETEILEIARQVLVILRYLHELSPTVIHRDIKPANLIERPDGSLALVDFGTAREVGLGGTLGSTLVGTFGYMPPEQLGGTVDATADLYALGATLLHLLTRREPAEFLQPGMRLDFEADLNATPRTRRLLSRLMSRSTTGRYVSAAAALGALDAPAEVSTLAVNPGAYRALREQAPVQPGTRPLVRNAGRVALVGSVMVGGIALASGAMNAARAAIERVNAGPSEAPALPVSLAQVSTAIEALNHGQYPNAIAICDGVIRESPDSPDASQAILVKAHGLVRMSRLDDARAVLTRYLGQTVTPHRDAALALLAEINRLSPAR